MQISNYPAEFRFLAGLCQFSNRYFDFAEFLSSEDFVHPAHTSLFIVLQNILLNQSKDKIDKYALLAKASELGIKDFYELCDNGELLDACLDFKCESGDVDESFGQVKRETVRRKLLKSLSETLSYLKDPGEDDVEKIVDKTENDIINSLNKLVGVTENKIIQLNEIALDIIDELAKTPGEVGLNIGFPLWQKAIGGIRNGSVTFVAASLKTGKSLLGMNAILAAAKQGIPVLYCDSELNKQIQSVRSLGGFFGINFDILETGWWMKPKEEIVKHGYSEAFAHQCELAAQTLKQDKIRENFKKLDISYLSINGMTVREAMPAMRRWVLQKIGIDNDRKSPRCLIIWDYIKLSRIDEIQGGKLGVHDVLGAATSELHDFAEKYNLPILAFGQTNRLTHREGINSVAGAKKIMELTDSCSILWAKDEEELLKFPKGTHGLSVEATRFGAGLKTHIDIGTNLGIAHFQEMGLGVNNMTAIPEPKNQDADKPSKSKFQKPKNV